MWFIINRFIELFTRDYSLEFVTKFIRGGMHCEMHIKKLDTELRNIILGLNYSVLTGYDDMAYPIYRTCRIATAIKCNDDEVCIHMSDYTYAVIINKLDAEMRKYYSDHSQIDTINGKK